MIPDISGGIRAAIFFWTGGKITIIIRE